MNIEINVDGKTSGTQDKDNNSLPCCKQAWTDVSETAALIIFILQLVSPGWGLFIAGIIDKNGVNVNAMLAGFLQFLLVPFFLIGWIWSILHGYRLYEGSKGKQ